MGSEMCIRDRNKSKIIYNQLCYSTITFTIMSNGETILPSDWQYLPLLTLLHHRQSKLSQDKKANADRSSDEKEIATVRNCLLWVYVTTIYNLDTHTLTSSSVALRLSRLSTVFLAAPDLFLDFHIHALVKRCLYDTLTRAAKQYTGGIKFSESKIPGIDSYKEFYEELITQFEAVSYLSLIHI